MNVPAQLFPYDRCQRARPGPRRPQTPTSNPGRAPAPFFGENVRNNRQRSRRGSRRKLPSAIGPQATCNTRSRAAEKRPHQEASIERQKGRLPAEPIHDRRTQKSCKPRGDRVRCHDRPKLPASISSFLLNCGPKGITTMKSTMLVNWTDARINDKRLPASLVGVALEPIPP